MKNQIRITKHKGINVGYCNNCNDKNNIYKIQVGYIDLRLCPNCLEQLKTKIQLVAPVEPPV